MYTVQCIGVRMRKVISTVIMAICVMFMIGCIIALMG